MVKVVTISVWSVQVQNTLPEVLLTAWNWHKKRENITKRPQHKHKDDWLTMSLTQPKCSICVAVKNKVTSALLHTHTHTNAQTQFFRLACVYSQHCMKVWLKTHAHYTLSDRDWKDKCPTSRTLHQREWTDGQSMPEEKEAGPLWAHVKLPPSASVPFQRRRKEERQLLESSMASAVFSRALNNKDTQVPSYFHTKHTHTPEQNKIIGGYHSN